ncbi:MAG: Gfo/Idh/MocA family oxidoreductase, partial [Planctomycetaceae bacterium]|nr:Gfo/Idh/MocA family oxidoreductase [Planctomycetaceae bacterium]
LGLIGTSRGLSVAQEFRAAGHEIRSVCDVDATRRQKAQQELDASQAHADFRRLLDDAVIDAVIVATPDHWHAPAAILALDAGKHVYVEKPCAHNIREGRQLIEAAERTRKVVQVGTQSRSTPVLRQAIQQLHDGVIGDIKLAKAWNSQRRANIGHAEPSDPPAGFDYELWVGPAPKPAFQKNCHHYTWHWWYDFGTGDVGNDGVHELDVARWGLGLWQQPHRVAVVGGKYFFDDDQQFPDTVTAAFEFHGEQGVKKQIVFEMRLWSTNYPEGVDNGLEFLGTEGRMFISRRGKFALLGPRNQRLEQRPDQPPRWDVSQHLRGWLDAIRGTGTLTAPATEAHLSASLCHLANIAYRVDHTVHFDADQETFPSDDAASALLTRPDRGEWTVPSEV